MPPARPAAMEDRLIVALDVPTIDAARGLVARIGDAVSFYKVGYWLLYSPGADALLAEGGYEVRTRLHRMAGLN